MQSEKELLTKARRLDESTLSEIYRRFSPGLYRYAARLLGDEDLAEDCVAEAFRRFIESLTNGGGPYEYVQAYLYQIVHNWITDQFRKQNMQTTAMSPNISGNGNDPARIVQEKIEVDRVRSALTQINTEQRQVIVLKYLEGWDNHEIALLLGKTTGAVRVIHHRGVVHLKKILRQAERVP